MVVCVREAGGEIFVADVAQVVVVTLPTLMPEAFEVCLVAYVACYTDVMRGRVALLLLICL